MEGDKKTRKKESDKKNTQYTKIKNTEIIKAKSKKINQSTAIPVENEFNFLETNDEDLWNSRNRFSEVSESEVEMSSVGVAWAVKKS